MQEAQFGCAEALTEYLTLNRVLLDMTRAQSLVQAAGCSPVDVCEGDRVTELLFGAACDMGTRRRAVEAAVSEIELAMRRSAAADTQAGDLVLGAVVNELHARAAEAFALLASMPQLVDVAQAVAPAARDFGIFGTWLLDRVNAASATARRLLDMLATDGQLALVARPECRCCGS